jgi:hypothetical protein
MVRKKPKFPAAKLKVCARFDQKREKGGTFCLAHFNILTPNRPSRLRINDSGLENRHFRGVRGNPFSQSIDCGEDVTRSGINCMLFARPDSSVSQARPQKDGSSCVPGFKDGSLLASALAEVCAVKTERPSGCTRRTVTA